ncbi:response regulator [bacterium D16-51]|nr:response regulator [bacterium D16-59]RKI56999.1 response regulator [bacterium D16-51]
MERQFLNVLFADDEKLIRQGLRYTINWEEEGFFICGEAESGEETLEKIEKYNPDLVILDIRMPRMYGTELMKKARDRQFKGEFIILSGYSDFEYAQAALRYGASSYLTKPVDADELRSVVLTAKEKILQKISGENCVIHYANKAKPTILEELLKDGQLDANINYAEFGLSFPVYQVVLYESYTPYYTAYNPVDLLSETNNKNTLECIFADNHNIILLKGNSAIEHFESCLKHYRAGVEKGSPLDFLFLTYGPVISDLRDIHKSYQICCRLMERRFFCTQNQHVLSYKDMPDSFGSELKLEPAQTAFYSRQFISLLQAFNRRQIAELAEKLKETLLKCNNSPESIKYFLIDIFLQIKQEILNRYPSLELPLSHNAAIIEVLSNKSYMYEIFSYLNEQFEMIMNAIGNSSSESILDDILHYIQHNYQNDLTLEMIAKLFGYNNSYLGKMFKEKTGKNFNSYLECVRIEHAAELLKSTNFKIYEISAKTGYKNVEYFQKKFKKIMGVTPTQYRTHS